MKAVRVIFFALLLFPAFSASAQQYSNSATRDGELPAVSGGCVADFTWADSLGYVFFIGNSSLGNNGVYFWDFGDVSYSTQRYPSHTYATQGVYQVCLTVMDSMGNYCDSTCHAVSFNSVSVNEKINVTGLSLSPNPANENAMLSFTMLAPGKTSISVFDVTGREIKEPVQLQFSSGKQQVVINTQSFATGVYFIQIIVNDQAVKTKLIVTHKQ